MIKIIHFNSTFKSVHDEDDHIVRITGFASTSDTDRAGDIILPEAWTKSGGIENFKKNPIILFNHNYNSPIGKATSISVTEKGLEINADISSADSKVQQLIKDEVLGTFSVGFMVKEADYIQETDGFLIKDAELFEISVVSVPANQDATFSLAKSFDNVDEYKEYVKQFTNTAKPTEEELAKAKTLADEKAAEDAKKASKKQENKMDPEELQKLLDETAKKAATAAADAIRQEAIDTAKAKVLADEKVASFKIEVKTAAESLLEDIEKRFNEKNSDLKTIVDELKEELTSKSAEIDAIRTSKRNFTDRGGKMGDWRKEHADDITDKYLLGLATGKGWNTKAGQELIKAVSTTSGVEVSSEDFEQIVSTSLERDIQLELVLADIFRELPMTSNTMILPIMPDSGYAQFVARNGGNGVQTSPHGNLDQRSASFGDNAGVALGERTITTSRLISTSFLGNETEEDAILPILGLIRESMVRSHARSMEQSILLGNSSQGVYTSGIFDGITEMAVDASTNDNAGTSGFLAADVVTAIDLFQLRKSMGKYGIRPDDVVYIVSQDVYFNLIEDAEFEDVQQVGDIAMKLRGTVGRVYGTRVIVCDEFPTKAAAAYNAICINVRNYLMPRLRGLTVESEYNVKDQQRVLVASQRIGFLDIIEDVNSVASLQYKLTT